MNPLRLAFSLVLLIGSLVHAEGWSVELSRDGAATVRYDGSRVLNFKYIAWGPSWKFATVKTSLGKGAGTLFPFSGDIKTLDVDLGGDVEWKDNQLVFNWNVKATKASANNIGGGLDIDLRLSPSIFGTDRINDPALLDGERGFSWEPVAGQKLTAAFEERGGKCYFEKGRTQQIRAMFVPPDIVAGTRTVRFAMQFPAGTVFKGVPSMRYADMNPQTWKNKTLDWEVAPIDVSFLNDKPAGSKGFVRADADRLVFGDGSEARFWGCNVQAYALFNATDEAIQQQAKRIAALGFNLVRIHHHDSADWAPSVFVKDSDNTQTLDDAQLDRIDYWVKCLKDNGVYVWLDLHIGRPFRPGDNIPAYDELNEGKSGRQGKGFNYVSPRITELMKEFAKAYLTRVNRYTKTKYTEEPAVMGILITNENDITDHFGNQFLPDKKNPQHQALFEKLRDAVIGERNLDAKTAWQTWMPGQSKVVLNEIQYQWSKDFVDYLHTIGVKVPIATTNTWGSDPLFSLPALMAGDLVDVHSYGAAESLATNPKHDDTFLMWIAAAQVAGKPLTITEWNTEYPARDRFVQPLFVAAQAAFQGWDAPMIYGYQQAPLVVQSKLDSWSTSNDPAQLALMPAAALMYRRGDVATAKQTKLLSFSADDMLLKSTTPNNSRAIRTLSERHRIAVLMPQTPLLPWLTQPKVEGELVRDPQFSAGDDEVITSDTGEIKRDWKSGIVTIDTPRSQAAMGWIGGREIVLGDVTIKLETPKAAIVISSLDGQPIATSKKLLLSTIAQVSMDKKEIRAEPVVGVLTFRAPLAKVSLLSPKGELKPLDQKGTQIELKPTGTHWYVLER